jgi:hypothetical protein
LNGRADLGPLRSSNNLSVADTLARAVSGDLARMEATDDFAAAGALATGAFEAIVGAASATPMYLQSALLGLAAWAG